VWGEGNCSAKLKSGEEEQEFDFSESFQSSGEKKAKSNVCFINRFRVKENHILRFRPQRSYAGNTNQLISSASHLTQKLHMIDAKF
jgi:hypothetical protein